MRRLLLPVVLLSSACGIVRAPESAPIVVFLSDFGLSDDAVAICKGVMLGIEPGLRIVDLTHHVAPYSIRDGARLLAGPAPYYPAGTVFVAVVDPGVGSARRALVARSRRGQYFVLPDNGLLTLVADQDGLEGAREITAGAWVRDGRPSSTFQGRDVFAPVAAHLARGEDWREVGPPVTTPLRIEVHRAVFDGERLSGEVIAVDGPYGNLITNVEAAEFRALGYALGDSVPVVLGGTPMTLPFAGTFSDVPVGAGLLFLDSRARLGLAVNQGNFAAAHRIAPPAPIVIPRRGRHDGGGD
jgi:hypothetical protein